MKLRITIACPHGMIAAANQFALCVGNSPADGQTFKNAIWENVTGERFALASVLADAQFPELAAAPLTAPDHAPDADVAQAMQAQSVLDVWAPNDPVGFPEPDPGRMIAVVGLDAGLAIPLLGLSPVPIED